MPYTPQSLASQAGRQPSRHPERGSLFLLWALTFSVSVLVLAEGYAPMLQSTVLNASRGFRMEQDTALANAGIELALQEIRGNNGANLNNGTTWVVPASGIDECDGLDGTVDSVNHLLWGTAVTYCRRHDDLAIRSGDNFQNVGAPIGDFKVWVVNYGSPLMRIVARGYTPSATDPAAVVRTATVTLQLSGTSFRYGAFGHDQIQARNQTRMDSYSSGSGAYGGTNVASNADIGTDAYAEVSYPCPGCPTLQVVLTNFLTPTAQVFGRGYLPAGAVAVIDTSGSTNDLTGGIVNQLPQTMPHVQIPSSLTSLTSWATPPAGVTDNGNGNYAIPPGVTWTCSASMKIRSVDIGGVLALADGCDLFVDNSSGTQTTAYLDTNGSGQVLKTGTGTTRVFLRDTGFDFDGGGLAWSNTIPADQRKPALLQFYQTCSGAPPCTTFKDSALATPANYSGTPGSNMPYAAIYVENGNLNIRPGNAWGTSYDAEYYGAYVSGKAVFINEWPVTTNWVKIHYDESLKDLALDGSGTRKLTYVVQKGTLTIK